MHVNLLFFVQVNITCFSFCRLLPATSKRLCSLGNNGRVAMYSLDLAYVYSLNGSLLYVEIPTEIRP